MKTLHAFIQCRSGATAIEYGLIAGCIALGVLAAVYLLGDNLYTFFYEDLPGAFGGE